jgi:hypothetical protein
MCMCVCVCVAFLLKPKPFSFFVLFLSRILKFVLGRKFQMMEGVSSTMIYCKNFCKYHNVSPQYNNNLIKKEKKM